MNLLKDINAIVEAISWKDVGKKVRISDPDHKDNGKIGTIDNIPAPRRPTGSKALPVVSGKKILGWFDPSKLVLAEEDKTDADEQLTDEDLADADEVDPTEDVGSVSKAQGFEKSKSEMYAFGKTRPVTLLTKDETLGGLNLTLQYVINPSTGAWKFRACLAGQSEEDMVEFDTGEDPSSLIKSLKKKTKITPHQAVEYLHPPANKKVEKNDDADETVEESFLTEGSHDVKLKVPVKKFPTLKDFAEQLRSEARNSPDYDPTDSYTDDYQLARIDIKQHRTGETEYNKIISVLLDKAEKYGPLLADKMTKDGEEFWVIAGWLAE